MTSFDSGSGFEIGIRIQIPVDLKAEVFLQGIDSQAKAEAALKRELNNPSVRKRLANVLKFELLYPGEFHVLPDDLANVTFESGERCEAEWPTDPDLDDLPY